MARINYEIPDELHRRAKAAAAIEGNTLRAFISRAIEAAVDKHEKQPREGGR